MVDSLYLPLFHLLNPEETHIWEDENESVRSRQDSTNHKSQTMIFCFLRDPLRCEGEKATILQILIDVAEKPKIQTRLFWHRRSRVILNSCNSLRGCLEEPSTRKILEGETTFRWVYGRVIKPKMCWPGHTGLWAGYAPVITSFSWGYKSQEYTLYLRHAVFFSVKF